MTLPHVASGATPSSSAQNDLIDAVNALVGSVGVTPPFVRKTSATARASTITPTDDPHMLLVLPEGLWEVTAVISANGAAAGDVRIKWILGGGATQATTRSCYGPADSSTDITAGDMRTSAHNWTTEIVYGTTSTSTASSIRETGLIEVAAGGGTLQMQWAQGTSNATNTTVSSNTWAKAVLVDGA